MLDGDSPNSWTEAVAAYRQRNGLDPREVLQLSARGSVVPNSVYYAAPDLSQLQVVSEVYRSATVPGKSGSEPARPRPMDKS